MFIVVLFITGKICKDSNVQQENRFLNIVIYSHNGILSKPKKNKLLIQVTWMNLKIILLSKRRYPRAHTTYMKYEHSMSSNNIVSFNVVSL